MNFEVEVFRKAGVSKCDISRLFGVSRTTVHNWHTNSKVHPFIRNRVQKITTAVKKATDAGDLPTKLARSPEDRNKELSEIIKKYL